MNDVLDKLPTTPLYENFNHFLSEAIQDKDDRAKVLDYVIKSQIIGNPLMEEFYMTQSSAVFQLICQKKSWDVFKTDIDEWTETLEPRMQEAAEGFFEGMLQFSQDIGKDLKVATDGVNKGLELAYLGMVEQTDRLVELTNARIKESADKAKLMVDAHFSELNIKMIANAETERRNVQKSFIDSMNTSMIPHIDKVFASSNDKFKTKTILRDVSVCLGAFCIFQLLKLYIF